MLFHLIVFVFNNFKSNNPEIFLNNTQIWYHVKSIQLKRSSYYDRNFVRELRIKMPNLILIIFLDMDALKSSSRAINSEKEKK